MQSTYGKTHTRTVRRLSEKRTYRIYGRTLDETLCFSRLRSDDNGNSKESYMTAGVDGVSAELGSWPTTWRKLCLESDHTQKLIQCVPPYFDRHPLIDICDTVLECINYNYKVSLSLQIQQIVLRGIMQCCRLVGTHEFSAWIGTVGDWCAVSVGRVEVRSR